MAEKKETHKEFSTCFEKSSFAEMMQKMMSRQGVGSLCAEMMGKIMKQQEDAPAVNCAEMMQRMMKKCCTAQEDSNTSKKEV